MRKLGSKKLIFLIAAAVLAFFLYEFADRQFSQKNISCDAFCTSSAPVPLSSLEESLLKGIFDQPFTYLDRGRQTYAFLSQDGQYVLKFFDLGTYRSSWLRSLLVSNPHSIEKELRFLLNGYQLAFDRDRKFSMILFLQIQPNPSVKQRVLVKDRFGFKHVIELDKVPFVIQRKAMPAREEISRLLLAGDLARAKVRFKQLLDMYAEEHRQGLYDRDHNVMYNTGFVGEHPIRIDVGRLRADERMKDPDVSRQELDKIISERIIGWLHRHFPESEVVMLNELVPIGMHIRR